jgi:hypothetical protein
VAGAACAAILLATALPAAAAAGDAQVSASAASVHSSAVKVAAVTPAKQAELDAAKAAATAKAAADAAAKAAAAAQKAADAVAKAAEKAKADAAKVEAAAAKALAAAKTAEAAKAAKAEAAAAKALAAAQAAEAAKAAKAAAAAAKAEAAAQAAAAAKAAKAAAAAAKAAQALRDAQAAKDAKALAAIPTAPLQLAVQRSSVALNNFQVTWSVPSGGKAKGYDVTVYADGTKTVYPVTKTALNVTGLTLSTVYRIEVASRDANGNGATSTVVLAPAVAGAPTDLSASATSPTAGVSMSWLPPTRIGVSAVDHYRVQLKDLTSNTQVSQETVNTAALFADADPEHTFEATVTAVSRDGDGLPMTVKIGDVTSTVPRGFTAIRDAHTPTDVNLAWSPPVWQAFDPVTDYEVGVGVAGKITWTAVDLTEGVTVSLPLDERATYYVRAVNAAGSSPADDASVDLAVKTQLPSSGAPVVLSADARQVDVALYGWVGDESADQLLITATGSAGYQSEQSVANGTDGVAFKALATGAYSVTVVGHDSETGTETAVFDGTITVDPGSASSVEASFDAGVGYWHGVYPSRHLPRVVSTKDVSFEGTGSMAITATWDSTRSNITAGTSGFGGIPVKAKQAVTVSALGRPGADSDWNIGISWWNASGSEIAVVRAKRMAGVVNTWRPSQSTYTAPAGAVSATAFIEIGGLHKGETFYVDGINLKSK